MVDGPPPAAPAIVARAWPSRLPIAVLVSGTGTNLQALLDTVHGREARGRGGRLERRRRAGARARAARGVPTAVFARADYADRGARDEALADWLAERGARLVVLAGYMELLGEAFLARFPGAVINVHPSLLPGLPRAAGDRAGARLRGEGVRRDGPLRRRGRGLRAGDPAAAPSSCPDAREPEEVLAALRPLEHALLPQAVRLFARGALRADPANPRADRSDRAPRREG